MSLLTRLFSRPEPRPAGAEAAPAPVPAETPSGPTLFRPLITIQKPAKAFPGLPGSDLTVLAHMGARALAALDAAPSAIRLPAYNLDMYAVPGFLSDEDCDRVIALIDAGAQPSTSLKADGTPNRRTSATCLLSGDDPMVAEVERRMAELLDLPASHGQTVQGQRYHPGQHFLMHNDYFAGGQPYSEAVASEGGQRTWTAMIFLNEPEAGGCTRFPRAFIEVIPRRGALLAWNNLNRDGTPNGHSHHEGSTVEAGVKHVLTKWFREREWHGSAASDALRS
jgi:prolyl 4-hydroxylase